tara:strand:+ start:94707 stop:95657 length:951 start_codon:yes stop_codon:yes gene_type:complete
MSTDPTRRALNGPTMGTRWSALFFAEDVDETAFTAALQIVVDQIDDQMSTWNPDSDLMRFNAAPTGTWVALPAHLLNVMTLGLGIGRASGGAFDITMGASLKAWGFGSEAPQEAEIRAAMEGTKVPALDALEIDLAQGRARKHADVAVDLNGIAKGYGVDRLAETLADMGISDALVGIDGEMRSLGTHPDGTPWTIAVEAPNYDRRAPHSVLALEDGAVATSGDYRHWVEVQGRRLSHTMHPKLRTPIANGPASVTVVAPTCAEADAWATAIIVLGIRAGLVLAGGQGLDVLALERADGAGILSHGIGPLFGLEPA